MSNPEQVQELLSYLKTNGHYKGFVCSLIEDNQREVVTDVLKEDAQLYIDKYNLRCKHSYISWK